MKEKINIAELLKDCPKGMELDCTIYDNVKLIGVDEICITPFPIRVSRGDGYTMTLTKYGQYADADFAKCVIFPKGKTTWEGFQRPFKDGDVVFYNDTIAIFKEWGDETLFRTYVVKYLCNDSLIDKNAPLFGKSVRKEIRFATEEEKEKLFKAINDNGYKWNPETKTLEKLIVPKFKVGDRIRYKVTGTIYKVLSVLSNGCGGGVYDVAITNEIGKSIDITEQDNYELVPNKFDITELKPFTEVLVRCSSLERWHIQLFERYNRELGTKYPFICLCDNKYSQCIPYEQNKHLLDTIDECDEYYKTWE